MSAEPLTTQQMHAVQDARDAKQIALGLYEELIACYLDLIRARCEAKVWGYDAEDVAQEVVFRLWRELKLEHTYPVPYRIVVHKVIGWTIKAHFQKKGTTGPLDDLCDVLPDPRAGAGYAAVDERDFLEWIAAQLPPAAAEVFLLRYADGLEPAEIAAELGKDPNAIHQTLWRIHNSLLPAILPEWSHDA
jgi:RNA polymerase sigma factor (sigma-70 family)